jgi:MFS family permease
MHQEKILEGSDDATRPVSLFRHADFMKLWTGETISEFGSFIGGPALGFAAVITLAATPLQMGVLSAAQIAPGLLFSLFAGVWVDRLRRRPIMIWADIGRTLILLTIPLAALAHALAMPQLYVVSFAASALDIFFRIAYSAYLPTLVGRAEVLDANSKLTASSAVAEVGGFALAGWLVQWVTAPFAIAIDAVSFLASAVALRVISRPEQLDERTNTRRQMLSEAADGARFIAGDSRLLTMGIATTIQMLFDRILGSLYMLFVVNALGFKPGVLGVIFAIGGVSSFFGAIAAQRAAARFGAKRAMVTGIVITAVGQMFIPMARGAGRYGAAMLIAHQLIADGALTVFIVNYASFVQKVTPDEVLGRVNACFMFARRIAALSGSLLGGVLGATLGLRIPLVIAALGTLVTASMLATLPRGEASVESRAVK